MKEYLIRIIKEGNGRKQITIAVDGKPVVCTDRLLFADTNPTTKSLILSVEDIIREHEDG